MKRLSKCLTITCCKTLWTFVLMMGFMISFGTHAVRYQEVRLYKRNGSFSSPGYPIQYPENVHYQWVFPSSDNDIVVDFVDMDLYRCYTRDDNQDCLKYDHVSIDGHYYCNWYKPTGRLILGPHKERSITFRTFLTKGACRGKGFKANYGTVPAKRYSRKSPVTLLTNTKLMTNSSKEVISEDMKVFLVIGSIVIALSLVAVSVCCCHRKRVKSRRSCQSQLSERPSTDRNRASSYSSIPQRGEQTEQVNQTRQSNSVRSDVEVHLEPPPITREPRGPPPTYDSVAFTLVEQLEEFESPPSYDSVIRGDLSANSRQSNQRRSRRSRAEDVAHSQRSDRRSVEEPANCERAMIPVNTIQPRNSTEGRRTPQSHNRGNEMGEPGTTDRERVSDDNSLSRDTSNVPRSPGGQNQDVTGESTHETGPHTESQVTDSLSRHTSRTHVSQRENGDQELEITDSSRSRRPNETDRANGREVFV